MGSGALFSGTTDLPGRQWGLVHCSVQCVSPLHLEAA